ncbi:MAG TPA: sigma factor-like helix-turn-helix DNA-binding protein [Nocardioides sp.]|nr:sigma factor-like helix-turn-helix DNA-binding protein [Nocardioides sp.]
MTKSPRRRGPEVLELVDGPACPSRVAGDAGPWVDVGTPVLPVAPVESFEEFYRREFPRLLVLARALAGDQSAEDVAQESMIVTYRQWTRIALLDSPVGYVRGICAHKAVSWTRRVSAEHRALRRVAARQTRTVAPLAPDSERFWVEVRRLPRRQAQVAALFYALDLPVSAVAETLGCAEGTVKVHLSRARAQLSTRLLVSEEES